MRMETVLDIEVTISIQSDISSPYTCILKYALCINSDDYLLNYLTFLVKKIDDDDGVKHAHEENIVDDTQ